MKQLRSDESSSSLEGVRGIPIWKLISCRPRGILVFWEVLGGGGGENGVGGAKLVGYEKGGGGKSSASGGEGQGRLSSGEVARIPDFADRRGWVAVETLHGNVKWRWV